MTKKTDCNTTRAVEGKVCEQATAQPCMCGEGGFTLHPKEIKDLFFTDFLLLFNGMINFQSSLQGIYIALFVSFGGAWIFVSCKALNNSKVVILFE
jgi:hypothetical protein